MYDDLDDFDFFSSSKSLLKSLASTSLSSLKSSASQKHDRDVNERIASSRREQRLQQLRTSKSSHPSSKSPQPFIPPPPPDPSSASAAAVADTPSRSLTYNPPSSSWNGIGPPPPQRPRAARTPAGPAPPRSWLPNSAASPSSTPATPRQAVPVPLAFPNELYTSFLFTTHLHSPDQSPLYTHPSLSHSTSSSSFGQPRLVHICLFLLSKRLSRRPPSPSASTLEHEAYQESLDELARLPRHLREVLVWMIGKGLADGGSGMRDVGVRTLMWDLRQWEEEEEEGHELAIKGNGSEGGISPRLEGSSTLSAIDADTDDDDWDRSSSSSINSQPNSSEEGWRILDLTSSHLSLSMLKLLLHPVSASPRPRPTPIISLSLASTLPPLPTFLVSNLFPEHLRHLDLSGIALVPLLPNHLHSPIDEEKAKRITHAWSPSLTSLVLNTLLKLSTRTPLLTFLDLSHTRPLLAVNTQPVASLPWTVKEKPCWPELRVLGLKGWTESGAAEEREGMELKEQDKKRLELAWKGRRGGWIELEM